MKTRDHSADTRQAMKIIPAVVRARRWANLRSGANASAVSVVAIMTQSSPASFTGA